MDEYDKMLCNEGIRTAENFEMMHSVFRVPTKNLLISIYTDSVLVIFKDSFISIDKNIQYHVNFFITLTRS